MTIGFRLRRINGAVIIDSNDLTMAVTYKNIMVVSGSGSITVSGISAATHIPMMIPYNPPQPQKTYSDYSQDPYVERPSAPKMVISGSTIYWYTDAQWVPMWYVIMAVRIK